jgi:hypothetical protein
MSRATASRAAPSDAANSGAMSMIGRLVMKRFQARSGKRTRTPAPTARRA